MSNINHAELEPIEKASLDELQALQLKRMQWSSMTMLPITGKKWMRQGYTPQI